MSTILSQPLHPASVQYTTPTPAKTNTHHDTCVICLSPLTNRAIAYPCNHLTFDLPCLTHWLHHRPTCPLCNTPVHHLEYDFRSPTDYKTYTLANPTTPSASPHSPLPRRPPRPRNAAQRRHHAPAPSTSSLQEGEFALARRREVYALRARALHRRPTHVLTPSVFFASQTLQRRARVFLRRELRVFAFLAERPGRVVWVVEYIVGMLCRLEIKGVDGALERLVSEVIGRESAGTLLHDLAQWLGGSWEALEEWDRVVQYAEREIMEFGRKR